MYPVLCAPKALRGFGLRGGLSISSRMGPHYGQAVEKKFPDAGLRVVPHLLKHLFHVGETKLPTARAGVFALGMQLASGDLVGHDDVLLSMESAHVFDEAARKAA